MKLMWILILAIVAGLLYNWYKKKPSGKKKKFKVLSSDDYVPRSENSTSKKGEQYTVSSQVDSEPRVVDSNIEDKYTGTTEGLQDMLFDDYGWAIYVLIYLAATSGSVNKKERDMIALFVKSIPKFSSLKDSWIDKTLKGLRRPGKMEIRNWVKAAIKKGADFSIIQDTIDKLETIQQEDNKEFWTFRKYIEKQMNNQELQNDA